MTNIIVVTSIREQQDVMHYLAETLKIEYHTDTAITIVQSGIAKIDVLRLVNGLNTLAASYRVILVPVSMSLDGLYGFSPTTNININRLLKKLDRMKEEAIGFVNARKVKNQTDKNNTTALAKAARTLFKL